MKIAIVSSKEDEAGMNIQSFLKDLIKPKMGSHEVSLQIYDKETIYLENLDEELGCDMIIFATKHESKSGVHSLSVHTQGNWGKAGLGGKPNDLGISPACWLKEAMKILEQKAIALHYEVIQEVTHHGPSLSVPSFFIEIGSSVEEWNNPKAGKLLAETIVELLEMDVPTYKTAVGIGGLHHTPSFKKIILNSDIALGHACPKYNLENLDKKMLIQAMKKTVPKAELVIIDWKGVGSYKEQLKEMLEGIDWKRTKDF
ncbi:hypothetical protein H8D36_03225 [archaeon]|nr:hypothetical protein [archaeon]MBL7057157.1 hypothetical protein [Candidatus Woesearchaeota archaeon]